MQNLRKCSRSKSKSNHAQKTNRIIRINDNGELRQKERCDMSEVDMNKIFNTITTNKRSYQKKADEIANDKRFTYEARAEQLSELHKQL